MNVDKKSKRKDNYIYLLCKTIIIACLIFLIPLFSFADQDTLVTNKTAAELFPLDTFQKLLGLKIDENADLLQLKKISEKDLSSEDYPSWYDLRTQGLLTPIKNQGTCAACWAFSAVAVFEYLINERIGEVVDLSEQYLINCVDESDCEGGYPIQAFKYMTDVGVLTERHSPYIAMNSNCSSSKVPDYTLHNYYSSNIKGKELKDRVKTIKYVILNYGVASLGMIIYSDFYYNYRRGVYVYDGVSPKIGNHAVAVVGWQDDDSFETGGFWICKNSWGSSWGERGYFRIAYDQARIDEWILNYAEWFGYNSPPEFKNTIGDIQTKEGEEVTFQVFATDKDDDALTFNLNSLPQGASFGTTSGEFKWTPTFTQAGSYKIKICVSDGQSEACQSLTISVTNVKKVII